MVKFRDQLRDRLKDKIPEELIELLPTGFQVISFAAIVNLKEELYEYRELIAQELMNLIKSIESVWINRGKIKGKFRKPEGLEWVTGKKETEVEHKENNIRYFFDFTEIMFAKGNVTERKFLPTLVRDGEVIVDMFAGIGYFSLSIGKFSNPEQIYSIEWNPVSFKYLKKNIIKNHLENKITPIHGDTKLETPKLSEQGIKADRIIMGVFPTPYDYISSALQVVKNIPLEIDTDFDDFIKNSQDTFKYDIYNKTLDIKNTIIHFEGVTMGRDITEIYSKFKENIEQESYKSSLLAFRFVKSFGPKMWHLVLDIAVGL